VILWGRDRIARHVQASWKTIQVWVETKGFPATKLDDIWISHEYLIDEWFKEYIQTNSGPTPEQLRHEAVKRLDRGSPDAGGGLSRV